MARRMGLVNTSAKERPSSWPLRLAALRSPSGVNGRSVREVWAPDRLHSVSPWRISHTRLRVSICLLYRGRAFGCRPKAGFREPQPLQTRYTFDDRRHMSLHDFISKQYIDVIQ